MALAGNQTLSIIAEMLDEVVARAVTAVSKTGPPDDSLRSRAPRASARSAGSPS